MARPTETAIQDREDGSFRPRLFEKCTGASTLARRPAQGSPAQKVQVDMIHGLSGCRSTIEYRPVPLGKSFLSGQPPRHREKVSDQLFIRFGEIVQLRNGFPGDDQDMYGRLRSNIPECETLFVLIHHIGRNVSIRDFLKKRSCIGHVAWKRGIARNIFCRRLFFPCTGVWSCLPD